MGEMGSIEDENRIHQNPGMDSLDGEVGEVQKMSQKQLMQGDTRDREPNDSCKGNHKLDVSNTAHGNRFGESELKGGNVKQLEEKIQDKKLLEQRMKV